jgi:hypothetical protein
MREQKKRTDKIKRVGRKRADKNSANGLRMRKPRPQKREERTKP